MKKGTKVRGNPGGEGEDQERIMEMYRELASVQQACIHALASALATTEEDKGDDDDDGDGDDEEGEDEEGEKKRG